MTVYKECKEKIPMIFSSNQFIDYLLAKTKNNESIPLLNDYLKKCRLLGVIYPKHLQFCKDI